MLNSSRSTTRDLRKVNRSKVLKTIYFNGPIERLEISKITELSASTVTNVVNDLLAEGVVRESGTRGSEGGRPSILLSINPSAGYIIGIDLGETRIDIEMFTLSLEQVAIVKRPVRRDENQVEQIVEHIVLGVQDLLVLAHIASDQIIGIGFGVPGLIDPNSGTLIFAPNWGWHNVPLADLLTDRLGMAIFMDNGAKTMALAESLLGAGRNSENVAVVLAGTGIGAGIVTDGTLYRGGLNGAGELGHVKIVIDGRDCHCGSKGCLEAYAGAPAIIDRYLQLNPTDEIATETDQRKAITAIMKKAEAGEHAAQTIITETAVYMGIGIADLINLANPELILLGGWVGVLLGKMMLPDIAEAVGKNALAHIAQKTRINFCQLGNEAVTLGAATLVLKNLLFNPIMGKKMDQDTKVIE